jgi:exonuclease VII small subunit
MSDLDFHRKLSALERRVSKLEDGYAELDNVVDPQGWIGEAFKLLEEDIDEVKTEILELRKEVNGKLDVILKHLTGLDKNS